MSLHVFEKHGCNKNQYLIRKLEGQQMLNLNMPCLLPYIENTGYHACILNGETSYSFFFVILRAKTSKQFYIVSDIIKRKIQFYSTYVHNVRSSVENTQSPIQRFYYIPNSKTRVY